MVVLSPKVIKVIKTDAEHAAALAEIERLMGLEPSAGTPEAEQLGVLALLVENYESKRFPITKPDPVEAIKHRMEQQGLSQRDLVPYVGSPSRVSEVLARKRPLTLSMIRALHSGLGIPAESLLHESSTDVLSTELVDWRRFPVREMAARGYFVHLPVNPKHDPEATIRAFIAPFQKKLVYALHKKTLRSGRAMDKYALAAWTIRVLYRAQQVSLEGKFKHESLALEGMREIAQLSWSTRGPLLAQELLAKHGIPLVIEPHLPHTRLDGAALLVDEQRPVVGLTLRYDRLDNFWFGLMHELAHVHLHLRSPGESFYDDLDADEGQDTREREADSFAREALIPLERWEQSPARFLRSPEAAQHLAEQLRIHPSIVAGRMRYESQTYRILGQLLGRGRVRIHFPHQKWAGEHTDGADDG